MSGVNVLTPEAKQRQARALAKNEYLRSLIAERLDEIAEQWAATEPQETDKREAFYAEHHALTEMRDFIYASIAADSK